MGACLAQTSVVKEQETSLNEPDDLLLPKRKQISNFSFDSIQEISVESISSDSYSQESLDGYEFVRVIGKGASSTVFEMNKNQQSFAVKIINLSLNQPNFLSGNDLSPKDEATILRKFSHPHIVRLYDFIENTELKKLYIVMELLSEINIAQLSTVSQQKLAFAQVVSALQYVHFQRIAHLDIKPQNILIARDGSARLTDFGISIYVPEGIKRLQISYRGTPAFVPPETLTCDEFDPFLADVWSLGATYYFCMFKELPFPGTTIQQVEDHIRNDDVNYPPNADPVLVSFLKLMLCKNPAQRADIAELWKHPYMVGMDQEVTNNLPREAIFRKMTDLDRKGSVSFIQN